MFKCLFVSSTLFFFFSWLMKSIAYLKLEEIHKDHCVQNLNELCQAWCSDFFSGKPASGTDHPLNEEPFPNV